MRFGVRLVTLLLVLLPAVAHADGIDVGGVNLRWDSCYGDGGVQNKNFACTTNTGNEFLVGSLVTNTNVSDVVEITFVVELAAASTTLPAWWQFKNVGACRIVSLTANSFPPPGATNCVDWTNGGGVHVLALYQVGLRGPNQARITSIVAVPTSQATTFLAGQEYFAFRYQISHAKTLGAASCSGCTTPVCLVFENARLERLDQTDLWTYGPTNLTDSDYATWQGGGVPVVGSTSGCPAATPAKQKTWGAVKSLYR